MRRIIILLAAALLAFGVALTSEAKSYSSGGGHSYSSHSSSFGGSHSFGSGSHSFSSGSSHSSGGGSFHPSGSSSSHTSSSSGGKSYKSSSGSSYSSGSIWSDTGRHSYTSGKSYSSGSSGWFGSGSSSSHSDSGSFTFDTTAARARKEQTSKAKFAQFKDTQAPRPDSTSYSQPSAGGASSYQAKPPPIPGSGGGYAYRPRIYIPDTQVIVTRPSRVYTVFNPYASRPWVVYNDPYSSLFWWWLLDRSLDHRAWWAYHHRYDMDPARYQALLATDQQLETRVQQLEAQQAARDSNYAPPGLDRDLMYSDQYMARAYSNRPTPLGVITFWALGVPLALAFVVFFIWLIWFKRWQTAT